MNKISCVLITRNEEKNISECLETVKWVDEIILIDQSSTDKTRELAKKFTDKIYLTEPKLICNPDREFGIQKATSDWILLLEADERVGLELKTEIQTTLKDPQYLAYFIPFRNYFGKKWIRHCGWYPAYNLRFFKKGKVYFPSGLHSKGLPKTQCGYLRNHIFHYSYPSVSDYIPRLIRYSQFWSRDIYKKGSRLTKKDILFYLSLMPFVNFFKKYILLRGFLDGFEGLFISFSSAFSQMYQYLTLWELQKKDEGSF
jgi:glycosyltransferase involved in cell wall biosynthesis